MTKNKALPVIELDIATDSPLWQTLDFTVEAVVRSAVDAAINHAALPAVLTDRDIEMSAVLADNAAVRDLNRDYRGKDKPTNVLSFAALDDEDMFIPPEGPVHIGDIILAYETMEAEAAEAGKTLHDHLLHLVVHGTLHLLGYDHIEENKAKAMESLEIMILSTFGIENPYADAKFMA